MIRIYLGRSVRQISAGERQFNLVAQPVLKSQSPSSRSVVRWGAEKMPFISDVSTHHKQTSDLLSTFSH